jgi:hypothetical protein
MCEEAPTKFREAGVPERDIETLHVRLHESQMTIDEAVRLYPEADVYRKIYGTTLPTALRYMSLWAVRWRAK